MDVERGVASSRSADRLADPVIARRALAAHRGRHSRHGPVRLSCRGERRHRHHHRRGGGQGPRPGDPQPVRDARGRPRRDDRGDLDGVSPRGRGRRALPRRSSPSWASPTVRPLHAVTRPQANDETAALAVRDATGVFLTGGNQLRLSSTIGGTRLADAMLERFRQGAVVAGHVRRRVGDVVAHDRVRGVGRDAEAPDGPDRGRPRDAARRHRRPALPAAEPARAGCCR